jgi:hypothetical protein
MAISGRSKFLSGLALLVHSHVPLCTASSALPPLLQTNRRQNGTLVFNAYQTWLMNEARAYPTQD